MRFGFALVFVARRPSLYVAFVDLLFSPTPCTLYSVTSFVAISEPPHTAHFVALFSVAPFAYYVLVALSDPRRPFARVRHAVIFIVTMPFSLTLYYIALSSSTFEKSLYRCTSHK